MSEIVDRIRTDRAASRLARDNVTSNILATVLGAIETKQKSFSEERPLTDAEVIAELKKIQKGVLETISLLESRSVKGESLDHARNENVILVRYIPTGLSEHDLTVEIEGLVASGSNLGQIMAALKAKHPGQYDGKLASIIAKGLLG